VLLGSVTPLDLPFDVPYWLSLEVNSDGEMSPRQQITSVGYAIHAEVADSISNVAVLPSGAIVLWRGATCPEGYTRVSELDGKFLASGATYNPAAGGSNTHTHGVGSYTAASHVLTIAEIPSHYHLSGGVDELSYYGYEVGPSHGTISGSDGGVNFGRTSSVGGSQGHSHSITGISASADSRPEFATILLCEKQQ
jgi:hypothetical protein